MFWKQKETPTIRGVQIPGRRYTAWAAIYFVLLVALPVLGITMLLDLLGWVLAIHVFDASCYGITCLF